METARLADLAAVRRFILGGLATFTLVSKVSGHRKTFRVRAAPAIETEDIGNGIPVFHVDDPGRRRYFVDLLIGPSNTDDYRYLCFMHPGRGHDYSAKLNKDNWGKDAFAAFNWMLTYVNAHAQLADKFLSLAHCEVEERFNAQAEFWHEGRCCRCGRALTDPASIARGIGPTCLEKGAL